MAIKLTVTTPQGFTAKNAYHRAECPKIGIDKISATVMLRSYRTGATDEPFFKEIEFSFPYDSALPDIHAQAYLAIKATDSWKSAEDC